MSLLLVVVSSNPHLYNPYKFLRYNNPYTYASHLPFYSQTVPTYQEVLQDTSLTAYLQTPDLLPTLNVLAEIPYAITNRFTVVPMLVVSKNNMKMVSNAHITNVSKKKPVMTIKTNKNQLVQCTPAVKIVLERPITVYSLKTSILFPSEIDILYQGLRIPINVGAVIAPVTSDTYVSVDTPISVSVVYAVPTRPVTVNYVQHNEVIEVPNNQAVIVESEQVLPPKNVTIIDFPEQEAEPVLTIDEADDELGIYFYF